MDLLPKEENRSIQCHFKLKLKAANNMQGNCNNAVIQQKIKTATAAIGKNQNPISRRKSKWKLKFHHQALPPEYLNHYEASLLQTPKSALVPPNTITVPRPIAPATTSPPLKLNDQTNNIGTNKAINVNKVPNNNYQPAQSKNNNNNNNNQSTVRYDDLPYMGEMTLDNARPRRGRKPKKADICHLIYKNYGTTTIVDEPLNLCLRDLNNRTIATNTVPSMATTTASNAIANHHISMRKFKFTAGAIPSLQEKKILSVNSVSHNNNNDNHNGALKLVNISQPYHSSPSANSHHHHHHHHRKEIKRKTRKSLAREKLEKTFKEKGFLIQTQQLESAQGATYCKFRQLKKFTRYLFRSWKNHLPGDIVNNNNNVS